MRGPSKSAVDDSKTGNGVSGRLDVDGETYGEETERSAASGSPDVIATGSTFELPERAAAGGEIIEAGAAAGYAASPGNSYGYPQSGVGDWCSPPWHWSRRSEDSQLSFIIPNLLARLPEHHKFQFGALSTFSM